MLLLQLKSLTDESEASSDIPERITSVAFGPRSSSDWLLLAPRLLVQLRISDFDQTREFNVNCTVNSLLVNFYFMCFPFKRFPKLLISFPSIFFGLLLFNRFLLGASLPDLVRSNMGGLLVTNFKQNVNRGLTMLAALFLSISTWSCSCLFGFEILNLNSLRSAHINQARGGFVGKCH